MTSALYAFFHLDKAQVFSDHSIANLDVHRNTR
jgi:hypothetical protein